MIGLLQQYKILICPTVYYTLRYSHVTIKSLKNQVSLLVQEPRCPKKLVDHPDYGLWRRTRGFCTRCSVQKLIMMTTKQAFFTTFAKVWSAMTSNLVGKPGVSARK